jgi:hypothetical protein
MKIFQVSEYISSAFDIILNKEQKNNILNCLEDLYIKKYINDEILLNLIKSFIVIFYNNPNISYIYSDLFNSLSEEEKNKLFNLLKKVNLSYQTKMQENTINKIILAINNYIINNNNYNGLLNIYNIYDTIRLNKKITFNNKVQLYIILLKNNSDINDVRQTLGLVNKFL